MSNFHQETVIDVHHWTDSLFSFRTTRDPGFRFQSGQFTMMGIEADSRPLTRAYSIASSPYDDTLEFFSIKVPHGPLTSKLQNLRNGDPILIGKKSVGTLLQRRDERTRRPDIPPQGLHEQGRPCRKAEEA